MTPGEERRNFIRRTAELLKCHLSATARADLDGKCREGRDRVIMQFKGESA